MTPLRAKMIRELELYRKAPATKEAYLTAVAQLADYYHRAPDRIGLEEIRDYLHHLITVQKVAFSTCNQKVCGLRFFYRQVLGRTEFDLRVPAKRSGRLPEPLSRSEVSRVFAGAHHRRARVLLMTTTAKYLHVTSEHLEGLQSPLDLLRLPEPHDGLEG